MQLRPLLKVCIEKLNNAGIEASTFEAGAIICYFLNIDKTYLYVYPEKEVENNIEEKIMMTIDKRCERIPLQYLLGNQEFMSLNFIVDENVLIPRQDTEILVETVIDFSTNISDNIDVLDIGTGSGCIAISLAKYIKTAKVTALDISNSALNIAKQNALINKVEDKVIFRNSDLFSSLGEGEYFDIIVSNPPYIPTDDIKTLDPEVRDREPRLALDGGEDGLNFYRYIIRNAKKYLKKQGLLAFEVGIYQAHLVGELFKENNFTDIRTIKDLAGIERVVCAVLSSSKA